MTPLNAWAARWNIPAAALTDLRTILTAAPDTPSVNPAVKSEAAVQQQIRLEASRRGIRLWRNNVGAVTTDDGRHIRFGLANDSAQMNKTVKSSDLIGITPVVVLPEYVGQTVGVFTSIEVKRAGWKYRGTQREIGQSNWIRLINGMGGIARFATSVGEAFGDEGYN